MTQLPPTTPPDGPPPPATPPATPQSGPQAPNPLSRLSTQMIVGLAAVVVLVLGGIGVLVGQAISQNNTPAAAVVSLPTTTPTTAGPGPTTTSPPPPTTTPQPGTVTLANGVATVVVPSGWTAKVSDDKTIVNLFSNGFFIHVKIEHGTNVDAIATDTNEVRLWLSGQNGYSQVSTGTPQPVSGAESFGTLSGSAEVYYYALWTGSGGSESDYGGLFAFARSDGSVLEMQEEAAGSSFDAAHTSYQNEADLQTIWKQVVTSFAGQ